MHKHFWLKKIIGFSLLAIGGIALVNFILMTLWNQVLTVVVPVGMVSFWQSLGILILSKILFGGFKGGYGNHRGGKWKKEMAEKWHTMTPEEREKIKEEWRSRCRVWKKSDTDNNVGAD
jgi:hypothetical protein